MKSLLTLPTCTAVCRKSGSSVPGVRGQRSNLEWVFWSGANWRHLAVITGNLWPNVEVSFTNAQVMLHNSVDYLYFDLNKKNVFFLLEKKNLKNL